MKLARPAYWLRALVLAIGLGTVPGGLRAEAVPDFLQALPGDVHTVASLGQWAAAGRLGTYRVIVLRGGVDAPATRLVVQWLRDTDAGVPAVEASREVEALGEHAGARVRPAWRARGTNRLEVSARVRTPDGRWRQLRVLATTPGLLVESR